MSSVCLLCAYDSSHSPAHHPSITDTASDNVFRDLNGAAVDKSIWEGGKPTGMQDKRNDCGVIRKGMDMSSK